VIQKYLPAGKQHFGLWRGMILRDFSLTTHASSRSIFERGEILLSLEKVGSMRSAASNGDGFGEPRSAQAAPRLLCARWNRDGCAALPRIGGCLGHPPDPVERMPRLLRDSAEFGLS